jgi:hypothetical protein
VRSFGRAGVTTLDAGAPSFARASERVAGNGPPWTGSPGNVPAARPGPHPWTQPLGGQVGTNDGYSGPDPSRAEISPSPRVIREGREQDFHGPPFRTGIVGFNDQLQVRDRHAYWSRGHGRNFGGIDTGGARNPNLDGGPSPALRTVNVSVNPQIGSDNSRNQDDLSRPYTWLGQWDGTRQAVYGGVPGLWQSYGNRGFADHIHDPSNGEGGPVMVNSGPPHGLHSDTLTSGKQIADRYASTPQMRPVRFDRPDNSKIAGQSYSQTVQQQSATGAAAAPRRGGGGLSLRVNGRGWLGGGG